MHTMTRPTPGVVAELVSQLSGQFGSRAVTSRAVREHHSHGEGLADLERALAGWLELAALLSFCPIIASA